MLLLTSVASLCTPLCTSWLSFARQCRSGAARRRQSLVLDQRRDVLNPVRSFLFTVELFGDSLTGNEPE